MLHISLFSADFVQKLKLLNNPIEKHLVQFLLDIFCGGLERVLHWRRCSNFGNIAAGYNGAVDETSPPLWIFSGLFHFFDDSHSSGFVSRDAYYPYPGQSGGIGLGEQH
jgi:hypothetical protein